MPRLGTLPTPKRLQPKPDRRSYVDDACRLAASLRDELAAEKAARAEEYAELASLREYYYGPAQEATTATSAGAYDAPQATRARRCERARARVLDGRKRWCGLFITHGGRELDERRAG